ncbi:MAG: hypothetical protein ACXVC0_16745, partial [Bdellovibrionota bacterium]
MKTLTLLILAMSPLYAQASGFSDCYAVAKSAYPYTTDAIKACGHAEAGFNDCFALAKSAYPYSTDAIAA